MENGKLFKTITAIAFWSLAMIFPNGVGGALAQQKPESIDYLANIVQFERLTLQRLASVSVLNDYSKPEELDLTPLSEVEETNARNLNSHWAWPEYTLEMIDSYSPFIFRTKKSQSLDEVKILLDVNSKGKVAGFEVLGEVDKGLKERLDHMIRKLPDCKPVPGYPNYSPERFELTLKK